MSELDDEVVRAAAAGDADALASAKVRRAAERLIAARYADAAEDLADVATIHRTAARPIDESRVLQAAATAFRAAGDPTSALDCALRARSLAPPGTPWRVAAETELGEDQLFLGHHAEAIEAYTAALDHAKGAGLAAVSRAALHRRLAMVHSIAGAHATAATELAHAAALFLEGHAPGAAHRVQVEMATALVEAGLAEPANQAILAARETAAGDHVALAELALLESARALAAGDAAAALDRAQQARREALEGGAVLTYVGAAHAIAELLDRTGDRAGAYDSLAVGWVTAADRVGQDVAGLMFRPAIEALRERWGGDEFERVKTAYYAAKRRS